MEQLLVADKKPKRAERQIVKTLQVFLHGVADHSIQVGRLGPIKMGFPI